MAVPSIVSSTSGEVSWERRSVSASGDALMSGTSLPSQPYYTTTSAILLSGIRQNASWKSALAGSRSVLRMYSMSA